MAARKRLGIRLIDVAREAAKTSRRGTMDITTVSHVLAGRAVSKNIVDALKRLIADARANRPAA